MYMYVCVCAILLSQFQIVHQNTEIIQKKNSNSKALQCLMDIPTTKDSNYFDCVCAKVKKGGSNKVILCRTEQQE